VVTSTADASWWDAVSMPQQLLSSNIPQKMSNIMYTKVHEQEGMMPKNQVATLKLCHVISFKNIHKTREVHHQQVDSSSFSSATH